MMRPDSPYDQVITLLQQNDKEEARKVALTIEQEHVRQAALILIARSKTIQ